MIDTKELISREKLIVIVRGVARQQLIPLAEAMYAGGVRAMELTFDAQGIIPDGEMADRIGMLVKHFRKQMAIGAGTVLKETQVTLTASVGGSFIVSPNTDPAVIRKTKALGLVSVPGAMTPTEITLAADAGADFVKVFPASVMGPGYIKAVSAPLSHIRLLAVGGITESNLTQYISAGACGIGVGADIANQQLLAKEDYAGITALAKRYTDLLKQL